VTAATADATSCTEAVRAAPSVDPDPARSDTLLPPSHAPGADSLSRTGTSYNDLEACNGYHVSRNWFHEGPLTALLAS
jgi:hypothetical protein